MIAVSQFERLPRADQMAEIRAHREEFLGRLLIGVVSTGIYCLPSCTARRPNDENVRLFRTEADAQASGLRACRRCRPDHFYRDFDPDLERLTALVDRMRREPRTFTGIRVMGAASGIGVTKLTGLARRHYQTSPAALLGRIRLEAARGALNDATSKVADVRRAAGFESNSSFHENFRKATGLSPKDYQRLGSGPSFSIELPRGFLAAIPLAFLARDPESPIERVSGDTAVKAIMAGGCPVRVRMEFHGGLLRSRVDSQTPVSAEIMRAAHQAVTRMLGLPSNPSGFERLARSLPEGARLIGARTGLRIPLTADPFEGIAWAIIGQQVNLAFACTLRRRLANLVGQPAGDGFTAHPTAEAVGQLDYVDLTALQYSQRKAEYLIDTSRLIASAKLSLDSFAPASQLEKRLSGVRGLGPWSVNYIMMRALGFPDCVPIGDTGLSAALQRFHQLDRRPGAVETGDLMRPYEPFRSLATYHLWMSLGDVAT